MAPGANILLVETPISETEGTSGFPQIVEAENYVIDHHLGGVISQSFSATEQSFPTAAVPRWPCAAPTSTPPRNGVTVLAASGDTGAADVGRQPGRTYYLHPVTSWPDSDPLVTGVGGTQLQLHAAGRDRTGPGVERHLQRARPTSSSSATPARTRWPAAAASPSIFARPWYQNGVAEVVGDQRGVPDISMSAACNGRSTCTRASPASRPAGTRPAAPARPPRCSPASSRWPTRSAGHPLGLINPALYKLSAEHGPGLVDVTSGNNTVSFTQDGTLLHGARLQRPARVTTWPPGVGTVNAALFVPELAEPQDIRGRRVTSPG